MKEATLFAQSKQKVLISALGIIIACLLGWATASLGIVLPIIVLGAAIVIPLVTLIFNRPKTGIIIFIIYGFLLFFMMREIADIPFSYAFEILLLLTWLSAFFHNTKKFEWANMNSDLVYLGVFWFAINVLEIVNPLGIGIGPWILDARYSFFWILIIPICLVVFNTHKDLNLFLILIIAMSLLAAINGIKQLFIGPFPGEASFIHGAGRKTHLLFGQLRVLSFYSDAGQFGASMAHLCVIAFVLALGPFVRWKRILCAIAAFIFLYCMSISGTRGALFTLIVGLLVVLVLNKNLKIILISFMICVGGFVFLKYTFIGNNNYQIYRMRTALDPTDASLNVRIANQQTLRRVLAPYPFGAGVGSIGFAASGKHSVVSAIPPDSYWVKIWASYGIIGLTIWFGIMMYIVGKTCGIVWNIKDPALRIKLTALAAGTTGIFICSYGNEVMNNMPSSMLVYISWAFIFLGPKLDKESIKELSHV